METGCVIVWTTIASTADGRHLASVLVGERLFIIKDLPATGTTK